MKKDDNRSGNRYKRSTCGRNYAQKIIVWLVLQFMSSNQKRAHTNINTCKHNIMITRWKDTNKNAWKEKLMFKALWTDRIDERIREKFFEQFKDRSLAHSYNDKRGREWRERGGVAWLEHFIWQSMKMLKNADFFFFHREESGIDPF